MMKAYMSLINRLVWAKHDCQ